MAGERIAQELRHDTALGDDLFVHDTGDGVLDRRHYSARVDVVEIPLWARGLEVDEDFLEGEVELIEGDVGAVGEGAAMVGLRVVLVGTSLWK